MSDNDSNVTTTWWLAPDSNVTPRGTLDVDVLLNAEGWLVLKPQNAVAALVLHAALHGDAKVRWHYRGHHTDAAAPYGNMLDVSIRGDVGPMLTRGNDPYFTGMSLNDDEQKACRTLVDGMREKRRKPSAKRRVKR